MIKGKRIWIVLFLVLTLRKKNMDSIISCTYFNGNFIRV